MIVCIREVLNFGRADFMIRSSDDILLALGGVKIFNRTISIVKLHVAWKRLTYATQISGASCIYLEGNSMTIIEWLLDSPSTKANSHPFIQDYRQVICTLLISTYRFIVVWCNFFFLIYQKKYFLSKFILLNFVVLAIHVIISACLGTPKKKK